MSHKWTSSQVLRVKSLYGKKGITIEGDAASLYLKPQAYVAM